ncbi:hypothetical protein AMAG_08028 [Allomyces macrogynus ATCC 38327]|uniref:Uncharacterized protein n=1 Tax=Allomyces macrogynus (strain ATCC 38327) TaxID=578462 RepID=A0A0L0SKA5_ALLM3|nr:hypothetical protein AMAG_08028 [Allomyces macrogynus ATCC 38327]|eukprot:KNE62849.1 hypothetical protein AMAG_08028 [Allomyces macrogynus ATCC 38327]
MSSTATPATVALPPPVFPKPSSRLAVQETGYRAPLADRDASERTRRRRRAARTKPAKSSRDANENSEHNDELGADPAQHDDPPSAWSWWTAKDAVWHLLQHVFTHHPPTDPAEDHAASAQVRRVDDVYYAACGHDTTLYAVGTVMAKFAAHPHLVAEWAQLGRHPDTLASLLATGTAVPMSTSGRFRSLARAYDAADALLDLPTTPTHSVPANDPFGFRLPAVSPRGHDPYPWLRTEAAQLFSVTVGGVTLPSPFPGQVSLAVARVDKVHRPTERYDLGYEFAVDELSVSYVVVHESVGEVESETSRLRRRFVDELCAWAGEEDEDARTDSKHASQDLPPPLRDRPGSPVPDAARDRARLYLAFLRAQRTHITSRSRPSPSSRCAADSDRVMHHLTTAPRHFVVGYFDELYALVRRLCYLCPSVEGTVYRGPMEGARERGYAHAFPWRMDRVPRNALVPMGDELPRMPEGDWTVAELEAVPVATLWAWAEHARIRHLVPADADAFTLAESLVVYGGHAAGANEVEPEHGKERRRGMRQRQQEQDDGALLCVFDEVVGAASGSVALGPASAKARTREEATRVGILGGWGWWIGAVVAVILARVFRAVWTDWVGSAAWSAVRPVVVEQTGT